MVDIKDLVHQADDLHRQADAETDPKIRDRLNRMAEAYVHIAEVEAGIRPASLPGAMEALSHKDEPRSAAKHPAAEPAQPESSGPEKSSVRNR